MLQFHFKMRINFLIIIFAMFFLPNLLLAEEQDSTKSLNKSTTKLNFKHSGGNDTWFGRDKGLHLVGSFIGTTLLANVNRKSFGMNDSASRITGAGVVFSLGIIKETFDGRRTYNKFSWKDLLANVTGILLSFAILEIN